jgi:hypothetical protein
MNPPVGAASWTRSRRRTALLQDGVRTSLSVNSRIRTPVCISSCRSPIETGLPPRFYATSRFTPAHTVVCMKRSIFGRLHLLTAWKPNDLESGPRRPMMVPVRRRWQKPRKCSFNQSQLQAPSQQVHRQRAPCVHLDADLVRGWAPCREIPLEIDLIAVNTAVARSVLLCVDCFACPPTRSRGTRFRVTVLNHTSNWTNV